MAFPSQRRSEASRPPLWQTLAGLGALVLAFMVLGWPLAKQMGIEVDEALIAAGLYDGAAPWYSWHLAGGEIPVMLLTYVGALKTWLYNPIFAIWLPGPISLRVPMMLAGCLTVILFFLLMCRVSGRRSAWIAAALLAFDVSYVITEAIDFGPVALQQLLKVGALLSLVAFHQRPGRLKLGAGFFLLGLALWDKAVFVWVLVGLLCAVPVIWNEVRSHLSVSNAAVAGGGFCLGALPLIIYNIQRPLETVTSTVHLAPDNPLIKLVLLVRTLNGSGAFGYFTAADLGPHAGSPHTFLQHASFGLAWLTGDPWSSLMAWATLAAVASMPLLRKTPAFRPALFGIIVLAVTWVQMFFTNGAGGAIHHVVLMWPFHILVIAVVLNEFARRSKRYALPIAAGVTALLCASDVVVLNSYYVNLVRNGTGVRWTNAFNPLHRWLEENKAPLIVTADWGILETLILLSEGALPVHDASADLRVSEQPEYRDRLRRMITAPDAIFIGHGTPYEQLAGTHDKLAALAATLGYSPEHLQTIQDRNGRPIFEIFRFRPRS